MKKKIVFSLLFICALLVFGVSCPLYIHYNPKPYPYPEPDPSPYDEEDRLSSWDSINQIITKPDNWQRLVNDIDLFQLGDTVFKEVWDYEYPYPSEYSYYDSSYGTFPAIDGSTVLLPLAAEFAWQFLDLSDENTRSFFYFSTTHSAYRRLIGDYDDNNVYGRLEYFRNETKNKKYYDVYYFGRQPDIILATSPSEAELNLAKSMGVALTIEPVCYDSFVFITHIDNPVDNLTVEQIRGIYSGQIRNWKEVGGADEDIVAFQRGIGSGSQTAMEEMVMDGISMMDAPVGWYVAAMGMLIDFVAEYQNEPNSIGYTFKYYVDRLYKNPKIKIIKINDVAPNDENVKNFSYPFVAPYNGVIRSSDINGTGGKFLNWMLSEEGQKAITQAGYVTKD